MVNAAARVVISSLSHVEKNCRRNVNLGMRLRRSSWKDLVDAPSEAPIRVRSSFLEGVVGIGRLDFLIFDDIVLVWVSGAFLVDFRKSCL